MIILLLIVAWGCRERNVGWERNKDKGWFTIEGAELLKDTPVLVSRSIGYLLSDSLGNEAEMDSSGKWTISGDTLQLLTMITKQAFVRPLPVVLIWDNDTSYVRPGDTIRVVTSQNSNQESIKYAKQ